MLAKILACDTDFKCTWSSRSTVDARLTAQPDQPARITALDSADLCVLGLRFRELPDPQ